jgi:hypothetical protein
VRHLADSLSQANACRAISTASSSSRSPKARARKAEPKPVTIIDTLDDPALFQPWFPGPSWNTWRTILKAAFGIALDNSELETFHGLARDRPPPERQVRELWIIAGRRAGKDSIIASPVAAYVSAFFGHAGLLRMREVAVKCFNFQS